jgi:PST family polysaccharide transporter/lipopolysaccharide exporter
LREIRAGYYMTLARYIGWITAPVAVATIVFAPAFIRTLYGPEWLAAIVPLQFLAIYGYIRSIAANMGSVFRAGGKPQWLNYIAGWRLATMALLLVPVTLRWGINGVSALSAAVAVVDFFISAVLVNRLVDAPPRAYIRALGPSLGAAIAAGALAFLLYGRLDLGRPLIDLLAAGAMLAAIYAGLLWLMDSEVRRAATRGRDLARRMWRERRAGHRTAAAGADGGGAK